MQILPHIKIRDFPKSAALKAYIKKKIDKLELFYDRIIACDVVVSQVQKHQNQGKLYNVSIILSVPEQHLASNHIINEDVYVAARDAFNAISRQLKAYARRMRGRVKHHDPALFGHVVRIFSRKGFGFIESNGSEYYFSYTNLANCPFERLKVGDAVQFIETVADEGLQAKRVSLGKHARL